MNHKIFLIFILICSNIIFSQEDKKQVPTNDLKVGLVLSGGGAKGFAHIGVLKVLEEAGVRIDYIAGTSMGAIVGALYASGYSANELDSIIQSFNYTELMQDKLPRKSKSFYQKENTEKYALTLPIKKRSIGLPSALSKGQNLFNELSKLTEHVHEVSDFSKLSIPFFCVATNLENGNRELLEKGFLPEAIMASGAFPTLLDPVEIDGKLLTDGGIVNNFPVDIMRKKGVDFIIGVDVQDKLKDREDINSAPAILMQIVNFQMYDDADLKRKETDLYLHPDISNYNVVSFDEASQIIAKGVDVASKQLKYLKEIVSKQKKTPVPLKIKRNVKRDTLYIEAIKIKGNKNYTNEYILSKLHIKEKAYTTFQKFNDGIDNLSATGNFKTIHYKFIKVAKGTEIHLNIKEDDVATFLQLGLHYDDLYKTGVLLNLTSKHTIFKNDALSFDFILGDNIRYNIDYFIDNGFHWSYGIKVRYNRFKENFFIDDNTTQPNALGKTAIDYNDFKGQLFLQTAFNKNIALRIGLENRNLRIFSERLDNNQIVKNYFDKSDYLGAFAKLRLDTYDKSYFTKKGLYLDINYRTYLYSSDFNNDFTPFSQIKGTFGYAKTFFNNLTLHYISEAGFTIGDSNGVFDYLLGGNNENFVNSFVPLYGFSVGELSDNAFLKSALTVQYELFEKNYVSFTGNFARVDNDLFNSGAIFDNTKSGFAVGYGLDSFIGPIEIKYTWSPDTKQNIWFFNVGFWF